MPYTHVTHIRHTHEQLKHQSWCGQYRGGFAFVDIDHAVYNAMNQGRLIPCKECVAAIIKTLEDQK